MPQRSPRDSTCPPRRTLPDCRPARLGDVDHPAVAHREQAPARPGSFSGQSKAYWKALDFVSAHKHEIPFERMISNRYRLDDVNTAIERMKNYEEIKPVIEL